MTVGGIYASTVLDRHVTVGRRVAFREATRRSDTRCSDTLIEINKSLSAMEA